MREAPEFVSLPVNIEARSGFFRISTEVSLKKIRVVTRPLDIGVSAVVKTPDGGRTHWALVHPGKRADFHRRDGFVLSL